MCLRDMTSKYFQQLLLFLQNRLPELHILQFSLCVSNFCVPKEVQRAYLYEVKIVYEASVQYITREGSSNDNTWNAYNVEGVINFLTTINVMDKITTLTQSHVFN